MPLVVKIEQAYATFRNEASRFSAATQIDSGLLASLYFARAAAALAAAENPSVGVQSRLQIVASQLGQVKALMQTVTGASAPSYMAHASSALSTLVIGPADTRSSASFAPLLAPASLGSIMGDAAQSPLASQVRVAVPTATGALPYELSGVSVTIGGRAAQLLSVSPSRIDFYAPPSVTAGEAEVIVTSLDGHVSRGTTLVSRIAPAIFTRNGIGTGAGIVLNSATQQRGSFSASTQENLSSDKRTRLMLFATGISYGVANTNVNNDINMGTSVLKNLTESVAVEARTSGGQTIQLMVEYAGAQGGLFGLDQINVVVPPELEGAGVIELTIIVGGQRSNIATLTIL